MRDGRPVFFSDYERRFHEGREFYKKYYAACNQLGADIVVFHGAFSTYSGSMEQYFERLGLLIQDAKEQGVDLCHENVSRCVSRTPAFFEDLIKAIPEARFVFDVKQAVRAGEDVMNFAKILGKRVRHIHLSDHDDSNSCLVPSRGTFNIPEFLIAMKESGAVSGAVVEVYSQNYRDNVELYIGYQHLLKCLSTFK
ncbi:MAG: sugar phosphate isomerase/epimerase [Oscillospiraceae bacterium]|nr:sugar phosphate isomerase/epimerase [Oscillospiraceae bacterium]